MTSGIEFVFKFVIARCKSDYLTADLSELSFKSGFVCGFLLACDFSFEICNDLLETGKFATFVTTGIFAMWLSCGSLFSNTTDTLLVRV